MNTDKTSFRACCMQSDVASNFTALASLESTFTTGIMVLRLPRDTGVVKSVGTRGMGFTLIPLHVSVLWGNW